jgi:hypothetical protein
MPWLQSLVSVQKVDFRGEIKRERNPDKKHQGDPPNPNRLFAQLSRGSRLAAVATTAPPPQKTSGLVADYGAAVVDRPWFARRDDTSGYRSIDSFSGDC